jgi:hypothetical protein
MLYRCGQRLSADLMPTIMYTYEECSSSIGGKLSEFVTVGRAHAGFSAPKSKFNFKITIVPGHHYFYLFILLLLLLHSLTSKTSHFTHRLPVATGRILCRLSSILLSSHVGTFSLIATVDSFVPACTDRV